MIRLNFTITDIICRGIHTELGDIAHGFTSSQLGLQIVNSLSDAINNSPTPRAFKSSLINVFLQRKIVPIIQLVTNRHTDTEA